MKSELTVKEAIEQGYTHWGIISQEWQTVQELDEGVFAEVEAMQENVEDVYLFHKKPDVSVIDEGDFKNHIVHFATDQYYDDTQRDDLEDVMNDLNKIDFSKIYEDVSKVLANHKFWRFTNIKLIPN